MRSSIVGPSSFVGDDLPPQVRRAPDPRSQDALHEPQPIVGWQGDEPARDLDDIKAEVATLADIAVHGVGSLREDPLDESAGGHGHVVAVTELDELRERPPGHQGKRAPRELQGIDVGPIVSSTSARYRGPMAL